jgi:16S rRNA processing protein RimM
MKSIGKVREAHGLKGDLYVLIFSGDVSWVKKVKTFALKNKGGEVDTYEIERIKPFKKGVIVKGLGITDRTLAEGLEHSEFMIDAELLVSKPGETIFLNEILNFKLKDVEQVVLGDIVGFSSNGVQDLLVIQTKADKKVEVPFVDAFIKKIDFKHQAVVMDLPEGLFDLEKA